MPTLPTCQYLSAMGIKTCTGEHGVLKMFKNLFRTVKMLAKKAKDQQILCFAIFCGQSTLFCCAFLVCLGTLKLACYFPGTRIVLEMAPYFLHGSSHKIRQS